MNNIKSLAYKYKHLMISFVYTTIYLIWWVNLSTQPVDGLFPLQDKLDDLIPFNEIFIIPYFLWFLYIFILTIYLAIKDKYDYYRFCLYSYTGITICLLIYTFFPVTNYLRPDVFPNNNIFTDIVKFLYSVDSQRNLCPSIHSYNSIVAFVIIATSKTLKKNKFLVISSFILSTLICISTLTLKQHSILDFWASLFLAIILYIILFILVPKYYYNQELSIKS